MNDTVWVQIKIGDDDDDDNNGGDDNNDDEYICCSVRSTKYAIFAVQKKNDFMKKCNKNRNVSILLVR